MRIVVVGATGNIGTALLRALTVRSSVTSVDAVSRRGPGRLAVEARYALRHHELDVATPEGAEELAALAAGADAVVDLAWANDERPGHAGRTTALNRDISRGVLAAAAGAKQLVALSCAAAYAPNFGAEAIDEDWPTTGASDSPLAQDKVAFEGLLDSFAAAHPGVTVTRLRPAMTLQESAGAELVRRHLSALVPRLGLGEDVPVLLWPEGLGLQVAHAEDVAAAIVAAVERRMPGAFNLACDQALDGDQVAEAIGAKRLITIPRGAAAVGHTVAWWTRLVRASPQWLDTLAAMPALSTEKAQRMLGVQAQWTSTETIRTAARGISVRREGWTPALSRRDAED